MKNIFNFILKYFAILVAIFTIVSCKNEGIEIESLEEVHFLASINESNLDTRAININNITADEFPLDIYIRMDVNGNSKVAPYEVKPGSDGRLSAVEDNTDLNWSDSDSEHTFYGWTYPWGSNKQDPTPNSDTPEEMSFLPSFYQGLGSDWNYDEKVNCGVLEKFIGTKQGPVSYRNNGEYVELRFQHLVSKIFIQNIDLILYDGAKVQHVQGNMTIYGIPKSGEFYRCPEDGKMPYVETNFDDTQDIEFRISPWYYPLYVAPGIDFKDLKFMIHVTEPAQHGNTGDYYGDFSTIEFIRDNGAWDEGKEKSVLYAGEMMRLNLTLTQGAVTGTVAYIQQWNIMEGAGGSAYPHKGVYSEAQYEDIFNTFVHDNTDFNKDEYKNQLQEIDDLFVDGESKDKKKINLYEDIDWKYNTLPIDPDYIFDGLGHTVTMPTDSRTGWPWPDGEETTDLVSIGNVMDIFITDGNGHTIYIDKDQKIWLFDEGSGELIATEYSLPPLTTNIAGDRQVAYQIDLKTGEVFRVTWNWV